MEQETQTICEYCREKKAVNSCDVCGSKVCGDCNLEYGCKVCGGGVTTVE